MMAEATPKAISSPKSPVTPSKRKHIIEDASPATKKRAFEKLVPPIHRKATHDAHEFLQKIIVGNVMSDIAATGIIAVPRKATILEVYDRLSTSQIHSAPVYHDDGFCEAFIDQLDLVAEICTLLKGKMGASVAAEHNIAFSEVSLNDTILNVVPNLSKRNAWHAVGPEYSLFHVADIMTSEGLHRVPVVTQAGAVVGLISAMDMCRFILENSTSFGSKMHKKVKELPTTRLHMQHVVSIGADATALAAFRLMHEKKVSAVAVVDADGRLVNNISASDLKLRSNTHNSAASLAQLGLSIPDYFRQARRKAGYRRTVTCTVEDDLMHVLVMLCLHRVHRLYVVDSAGRPIQAITLSDVISEMVQ